MIRSIPHVTPAWHARRAMRIGTPNPVTSLSVANAISVSGNVIATVAIPWLVLGATGSATLAALSIGSGAAAAAVGALAAGRIVDVLGPTRASAAADLVSGFALVPIPILAAIGVLEVWHLVVLVFLGTLLDAAGSAARQSLVPIAGDASGTTRDRANSLFAGTEHAGYLIGAPLAGLVIASVGAAPAIWLDIATFGVSALLVGGFAGHALKPRPGLVAPSAAIHESTHDRPTLRDAAGLIRSDPVLRALVVVPTLATILIGPLVPILLPVVARDTYRDPVALGVLVSAFGAGGLSGAFGFGLASRHLRRRTLYLVTFAVWPFVYLALAAGAPIAVAAVVVGALGVGTGMLVTLQASVRQERTPPPLLPRVVGLSTGPVPVVGPVAVLVVGIAIDRVGIGNTLIGLGIAVVALAVGVARLDAVRQFDLPTTASDAPAG